MNAKQKPLFGCNQSVNEAYMQIKKMVKAEISKK